MVTELLKGRSQCCGSLAVAEVIKCDVESEIDVLK